jgi:iron complex transport system permease protein
VSATLLPAPSRLEATAAAVARNRARRNLRRRLTVATLTVLVAAAFVASLLLGHTYYTPGEVLRVILGEEVHGATFTVGRLRLPRAVTALATGASFGIGGVTFQTMLRNPLASPDVIGITSGAGAAAAFAIVSLSLSGTAVSMFAIAAALSVALLIYVLSYKDGVAGTRLVLIGIGIAAMLHSFTFYVLSQAAEWNLAEATRWLTGSLNGSKWKDAVPVLLAMAVFVPALLTQSRNLSVTRLGDDTAGGLGVRVERTRLILIVSAVALIAFATAATGPIAFVAFLSGPIAARLVGGSAPLLIPSALVGALLVLVADLCGQYAFSLRYPVGVVTGVLGAPYLLYLIVRTNRAGGSL